MTLPVKLHTFLDDFVPRLIKKALQNSLSDVKEFEEFIKCDTLSTRSISNLCCFVFPKIVCLLLDLYGLCPRKEFVNTLLFQDPLMCG